MLDKLFDLDDRGVRAFVKYSTSTGKWGIECYRKKIKSEIFDDSDWNMIRVGSTQSYFTRNEALEESIKLAERICLEYNF